MKKKILCLLVLLGPIMLLAKVNDCLGDFNEGMNAAETAYFNDINYYCNTDKIFKHSFCQYEAQLYYCATIDALCDEFNDCMG
jgi:hypothetical protein